MLIRLDEIHKAYGSTVLFDGASAVFTDGDKIGLIGRNGSGKTTLCRLLLGEDESDAGAIVRGSALRLGYLEQRDPFGPDETAAAFLERSSGREPWRCAKIAGRFRVSPEQLAARVHDLAGGFQTRLKLASMLLKEPNFLVLDEPTNYLDLTTQLLMERFLLEFRGGFLIVSHDREFLKRTCDRTLEVERGALTLYRGDIESFLEYKEGVRGQAEAHNRQVELKRRHLQDFIDRNRARAATASRAQSKIKQRDRLRTIEIAHPIRNVRIRIPAVVPGRGMALRCADLAIGYGHRRVASGLTFNVRVGERVAVLGENGEGKTTFLKTIAGQIPALGGEHEWGSGLVHGYYAQHVYTTMAAGQTVYETLKPHAGHQEVLDMAGAFLFGGDEVEKPVGVLSGGERSRLCLASLLLSRRPVLLLDEPTNHLDFETVEALGEALQRYEGTLFFVSHDRTFVNLVATNILDVRAGTITLYPGDYESYVGSAEQSIEEVAPPPKKRERRREKTPSDTRLQREIAEVERRMVELEAERTAIHEHYLANPTDYSPEKKKRLDELERLLPEVERRWMALHEQLEREA